MKDALELLQSVHSSDRDRLEAEMTELAEEIKAVRGEHHQQERLRMKEETLASHRERLDLIAQQESHAEGLLHQCGRCEASLHRTRIQLAELKTGSSEVSIGAVTETLRQAIDQAKQVQEELRSLGY